MRINRPKYAEELVKAHGPKKALSIANYYSAFDAFWSEVYHWIKRRFPDEATETQN